MAHDYLDELLELAASICALADAEGRLDKREWKSAKQHHDGLEAKFSEVRNRYVDALLVTPDGRSQAYDSVAANLGNYILYLATQMVHTIRHGHQHHQPDLPRRS